MAIPREEEPQISVPMVDIHVRADGLEGRGRTITKPLETIVRASTASSTSIPERGTTASSSPPVSWWAPIPTTPSCACKVRANYDRMPIGIPEPLIVGRGINDVRSSSSR